MEKFENTLDLLKASWNVLKKDKEILSAWQKGALLLPLGIFAVAYLLILAIFQSALQGIFQAALYQFARFGNAPPGFHEEQLRYAIKRKF